MKSQLSFRTLLIGFVAFVAFISAWTCPAADRAPDGAPVLPPVLGAMQGQLDRSFASLSKADPPAYFIGYTVSDRTYTQVSGSNGALLSSSEDRGRWLEVQTRVG